MKYIIWGCGKRGTALALLLGKNKISAFIDSNIDLIGTFCMDIPVISYEDCLIKRQQELVIVAAKGFEKSIGAKLNQAGVPWIAVETPECIYILNQVRLVINKILSKDACKGKYLIYGWNVYGIYIYECLKAYQRECSFIFYNVMSDYMQKLEFPVIKAESLKDQDVERIFLSESNNEQKWDKKICVKITNIYEIYREFDLFYNPTIERFHNIHKGERCFIVATGPSLCVKDLDILESNNEICMSVNGIFKVFEKTKWRPDYYFLSDLYGLLQWQKDILQMEVKEKFIADTAGGLKMMFP